MNGYLQSCMFNTLPRLAITNLTLPVHDHAWPVTIRSPAQVHARPFSIMRYMRLPHISYVSPTHPTSNANANARSPCPSAHIGCAGRLGVRCIWQRLNAGRRDFQEAHRQAEGQRPGVSLNGLFLRFWEQGEPRGTLWLIENIGRDGFRWLSEANGSRRSRKWKLYGTQWHCR